MRSTMTKPREPGTLSRHENERDESANVKDQPRVRAAPGVIHALDQALALANQAVLRCKWQYGAALRYHSPQFAAAALGHANEARIHAGRIVDRIAALGGEPEPFTGADAMRRHGAQRHGKSLAEIIAAELAEARYTIQGYRKIAAYLAEEDRGSAAMMEGIAAGEETCATELSDVLAEQPEHAQ